MELPNASAGLTAVWHALFSDLACHVLAVAAATGTAVFLWKLYRARSYMRQLRRQGMPMPPHHWLLGHLLVAARVQGSMPPGAHYLLFPDQVRRAYPDLDTAFYFDVWPFAPPVLMVVSPDLAYQFTQEHSLPKHGSVRKFLAAVTGKKDLASMEGDEWKHWRTTFNPGFRFSNIMDMLPTMVQELRIFRDIIRGHAEAGDVFPLEVPTLFMSADIIGRVVLDDKFESQTKYNALTAGLHDQLAKCESEMPANPLRLLELTRPFMMRYNTWRMNSYVDPIIQERYRSARERPGSKHIVDLVVGPYSDANKGASMPPEFAEFLRSQVKLFLQAGHDTIAATIVFTLDLLSRHPDILARLRAELDDVLGPTVDACDLFEAEPHLLNQCNLLLAVVKEALRVYPPAGTARAGAQNFFLADGARRLPTEHCMVLASHFGIHHNPRFWVRADDFVPDRWLVPDGDPLRPGRNAWRPFERGPRGCIGQELAMVEIRLVVAVMVREFDFHDAYAETDRKQGWDSARRTVNGHRVYQIQRGGGHPSENYPCRVTARSAPSGEKSAVASAPLS